MMLHLMLHLLFNVYTGCSAIVTCNIQKTDKILFFYFNFYFTKCNIGYRLQVTHKKPHRDHSMGLNLTYLQNKGI